MKYTKRLPRGGFARHQWIVIGVCAIESFKSEIACITNSSAGFLTFLMRLHCHAYEGVLVVDLHTFLMKIEHFLINVIEGW